MSRTESHTDRPVAEDRGPGLPEDGIPAAPADTAASTAARTFAAAVPTYESSKLRKFDMILSQPVVDLSALEAAAWTGVPHRLRPQCWRLLLRYEPPNRARSAGAVRRKRSEYAAMVPAYYDVDNASRSDDDLADLKQVSVDVPRTAPDVAFFQAPRLQTALRRLLYIWGVRHPASGYVQGVNDLATPFLAVFLSEHFQGDIGSWDASALPDAALLDAEADAFWCLCKLVERVQDVYTAGQPGITRCLRKLEDVLARVDGALTAHLAAEGLAVHHFAFRWVNCMLLRELPFRAAVRLWDTYLAEGRRFSEFLPFACVAFLLAWAPALRPLDFQGMILFLQKPPTADWGDTELELVLSHAHMLRASFDDAQGHFGL